MSIEKLQEILKTAAHVENNQESGFTDVVFVDPHNIKDNFLKFQLEIHSIFGAESIFAQSQNSILKTVNIDLDSWIDFGFTLSESNAALYGSEHIIVVGEK